MAPSISPFHDASTLSSRCGRTRRLRASIILRLAEASNARSASPETGAAMLSTFRFGNGAGWL